MTRRATRYPALWTTRLVAAVVCVLAMLDGTAAAELSATQRQAILAEAQQAYDRGVALRRDNPDQARGAFEEAAARYQQLVDDGVVNGSLQYNLANAQLQAGQLGRAIAHYRAAEALMPGAGDVQHNLQYARSLRENQITPEGAGAIVDALLSWHRQTSFAARLAVFVLAYLVFWAALSVQVRRPAARWRWIAAACAVLWIPLGVSAASDVLTARAADVGVIVADDVTVRKGNGEGFEPQFRQTLNEGVEFTLRERRAGWLQIELRDGKTGWIRADQAVLVSDVIDGARSMRDYNPART